MAVLWQQRDMRCIMSFCQKILLYATPMTIRVSSNYWSGDLHAGVPSALSKSPNARVNSLPFMPGFRRKAGYKNSGGNPLGDPPALPVRQKKFDRSGSPEGSISSILIFSLNPLLNGRNRYRNRYRASEIKNRSRLPIAIPMPIPRMLFQPL